MDIQTLLNNLHEEVSCAVCMSIYTNPKQLPCLHSFCLDCLKELRRTSSRHDQLKCPNCQAVSRVPESGNLQDLPTSFYLNGLVDVLAIKECHNSEVRCGNCDKTSSESCYCFQCCVFWCIDCINVHNALRSNKDHRVLSLKDFQNEDFEDLLKRPVFCPKQRHETEQLKFFCQQCNEAVCQTCVLIEHSGHSLQHIEEQAEKQKLEINSLIEAQTQKLQDKTDALESLNEQCARVKQHAEKVKKNVQDFVDDIVAIIESKEQDIFEAVESQTTKSLKSLEKQRSKIQERIETTESVVEKTKTLLNRNTSAGIIQLRKSVETMFQNVDKESEIEDNYEDSLYFAFVQNENILPSLEAKEIGSIEMSYTKATHSTAMGKGLTEPKTGLVAEFVVTTRNAQDQQCYCKSDILEVQIKDQKGQDCATEVQACDHKDGTYNIRYFVSEAGDCQVVVKVNGEHIQGSPFSPEVKAREFTPVLSFGGQGSSPGWFEKPWGVAVNNVDEIAVTDYETKRVQIFTRNGNLQRYIGATDKAPIGTPRGITIDTNGNILVADSANNRILTLSDFNGEPNRTFAGTFSCPRGLSVDNNGNIMVASQQVYIFSPSGNFIGNIGEKNSFKMPWHCIEHDGYYIVSDGHGHCIKVFDKERKFLYKFGKHGKDHGQFNEPHGLSIDKAGNLLVCDTFNHRIQAFKLNGEFLRSFGTHGNTPGHLDRPESVAVLSNGRIVVCGSKNHRIQIFE